MRDEKEIRKELELLEQHEKDKLYSFATMFSSGKFDDRLYAEILHDHIAVGVFKWVLKGEKLTGNKFMQLFKPKQKIEGESGEVF